MYFWNIKTLKIPRIGICYQDEGIYPETTTEMCAMSNHI